MKINPNNIYSELIHSNLNIVCISFDFDYYFDFGQFGHNNSTNFNISYQLRD